MTDDLRRTRGAAWGNDQAAAAYERLRPAYPIDAVDWLVPEGARRVLDLGAGTGKLTRALKARDLEVDAVDPSAAMLRQLAVAVPGVPTFVGKGEAIPLPDSSVDAVVCGQAWHWMDAARASAEVARVLRPGGVLGLIWNGDDDSVGWVAELRAQKRDARGQSTGQGAEGQVAVASLGISDVFRDPEERVFRWRAPYAVDDIVELVTTRSYILTAPPETRSALTAAVRALLATHPDTAGLSVVELPMVTTCVRAVLG